MTVSCSSSGSEAFGIPAHSSFSKLVLLAKPPPILSVVLCQFSWGGLVPPYEPVQAIYVQRFMAIVAKYGLSVTEEELAQYLALTK